MERKIADIIIIAIVLMIILPIVGFAATGTVITESLNLRKEASTESGIIKILNNNEKIEILSEEGDWYKIQHGENTGYVKKEYIELEESASTEKNKEESENAGADINNSENTVDNIAERTTLASINGNIITFNGTIKIKIIPAINGSVIGESKTDSQMEIVTQTNHWIFVQNDEISGWIAYNEISQIKEDSSEQEPEKQTEQDEENEENNNDTESTKTTQSTTKYVNASSVYIRSKPTTDSDAITSLIRNTDVKVVGEEGDWYQVVYGNDIGYIRKDLLSDAKSAETSRDGDAVNRGEPVANVPSSGIGSDIVNYAYGYLGCPYVYGGSGPSSFDCSGFTAYVYSHFGYSLPHNAVTQMNYGVEVGMDNLEPGDLVFFLDYQTMDGVGHCGIYIGDGNFIHASSGSGYCVKTSTLLSGSYRTRYYTARRLV